MAVGWKEARSVCKTARKGNLELTIKLSPLIESIAREKSYFFEMKAGQDAERELERAKNTAMRFAVNYAKEAVQEKKYGLMDVLYSKVKGLAYAFMALMADAGAVCALMQKEMDKAGATFSFAVSALAIIVSIKKFKDSYKFAKIAYQGIAWDIDRIMRAAFDSVIRDYERKHGPNKADRERAEREQRDFFNRAWQNYEPGSRQDTATVDTEGMTCEKACAILAVSKGASEKEIKASFRRLVKKYHPQYNNGSEESTLKTREILEAYEFLLPKHK